MPKLPGGLSRKGGAKPLFFLAVAMRGLVPHKVPACRRAGAPSPPAGGWRPACAGRSLATLCGIAKIKKAVYSGAIVVGTVLFKETGRGVLEQINRPGFPQAAVLFDACVNKLKPCNGGCSLGDGHFCRHKFEYPIVTLLLEGRENKWKDSMVVWSFFEWIFSTNMFQGQHRSGQYSIITKDIDFVADAKAEYEKIRKRGRFLERPNLVFFPAERRIVSGQVAVKVILLDCLPYGTDRVRDQKCIIEHVNLFCKV